MLPYSPTPDRPQTMYVPPERPGPSKVKRLAEALMVLVAVSGAAFVYYYLFLRIPEPVVALTVTAPDQILLGEPFTLTVAYTNTSEQVLKRAKLSLALPEGVVLSGGRAGDRHREEAVGDIPAASSARRSFTVLATEGSQSLKRIDATLRYDLDDAGNARFQSSTSADIAIGSSAAELSFAAPQRVLAGEAFTVTLAYRNTSRSAMRNARLDIASPAIFREAAATSSPAIIREGGAWRLGDLPAGAEGKITLVGSALAEEQSFFALKASLSADFEGQAHVLSEQETNIAIAASPLAITILANDKEEYVTAPGRELHYTIRYKNTTQIPFQNITVSATLSGAMFDYGSLRTSGAFSSVTNVIVWSSANTAELAALPPGAERKLEFSIGVKDAFPIRRIADKHFTLKVEGKIQSPTVPPGVESGSAVSLAKQETKVAGSIALEAPAFYYEPGTGIKNTGPYPPRVNKATQFTIHWRIRTTADDMKDVRVAAKLGPGVRFTGVTKNALGGEPVYDSVSGEVSWTVPRIVATTGTIAGSSPAEAVFQVEVTPAINQVGQDMLLIGESRLRATDEFTGQFMEDVAPERDTDMRDDPRVRIESRTVKP